MEERKEKGGRKECRPHLSARDSQGPELARPVRGITKKRKGKGDPRTYFFAWCIKPGEGKPEDPVRKFRNQKGEGGRGNAGHDRQRARRCGATEKRKRGGKGGRGGDRGPMRAGLSIALMRDGHRLP